MIVIELDNEHELAISTGYSDEFKFSMNALPKHLRHWEKPKNAWIVKVAVFDQVHELLDEIFPGEKWAVSEAAQDAIQREYKQGVDSRSSEPPKDPGPPTSYGPYAALYVNSAAPNCVINAAYKALARMHHPDLGGDNRVMGVINAAYEELKRLRGL